MKTPENKEKGPKNSDPADGDIWIFWLVVQPKHQSSTNYL
jgi:hypothetical protein